MTFEDLFRREIQAEAYSWKMMGKPPTVEILGQGIREMLEGNVCLTHIMAMCRDFAPEIGFTLSKQDLSDIWWYCRDYRKTAK